MSRKAEASTSKIDARVRRTRDALGDALLTLMQEKAFETITVQEVLDRAGIGRSTFYAHYRDKNDLFLSDLEDFLEPMSTVLMRCGRLRIASLQCASCLHTSPRCASCRQR
jgi:AcrR family transcriptional regulator